MIGHGSLGFGARINCGAGSNLMLEVDFIVMEGLGRKHAPDQYATVCFIHC